MAEMNNEKQLPKRKQNRLKEYNYSADGWYFITICTKGRIPILSRIVGSDILGAPQVQLLACGKIVEKNLQQLQTFYVNIKVEQYVIMPNHVHMILSVSNNGAPGMSPPTKQCATIPLFVATLKRFCNKEFGEQIWQRSFYDHIIRDQNDGAEISRYIYENPIKWSSDKLFVDEQN